MLRFYYNPSYKYTNRQIISLTNDTSYRDIDYVNIDSPDTINGHIIYTLETAENIPTYILDLDSSRRWFVSGITQLRTGKYQISLLRDIISESPELWSLEQAYITAGKANDYNKYKTWGLPFTNTKIKEQRLDINGKSSFFVFYVNEQDIANDGTLTEKDFNFSYNGTFGKPTGNIYRVTDITEMPLYFYMNTPTHNVRPTLFFDPYTFEYDFTMNMSLGEKFNNARGFVNLSFKPIEYPLGGRTGYHTLTSTIIGSEYKNNYIDTKGIYYNPIDPVWKEQLIQLTSGSIYADILLLYPNTDYNIIDREHYNEIDNIINNNQIIYDEKTDKYYKIFKNETKEIVTFKLYNNDADTKKFLNRLKAVSWLSYGDIDISVFDENDEFITVTQTLSHVKYTLNEIYMSGNYDFKFLAKYPKLPKSSVRCVNLASSSNISDNDIASALMLAQTNPAMTSENINIGRILDIQYLPFSTGDALSIGNNLFTINGVEIPSHFVTDDDWGYLIDLPDIRNMNKETDTIKVISPSRASQFLFKPYNNEGKMKFDIKITLKPYASTIYIRPNTDGLLLTDWNDKDCLVIQEDFSLTSVTSNWANYIYNNRNYQSIFDRQIQGREFERTWERKIEDAQAKSDEWTSRNISSQKARTYTGNLPIISDIASAIGTAWKDNSYMQAAQLDREYNEALYQESMSLARDNFRMQLENIQSQPTIPSKITTIDIKLLDGIYLEFYSTNETELNAIKNFYKYNGERIDDYGSFAKYWGWFVRGKIIISNNYTQPEIDELNRRLNIGIFTGESYD